jgi:hypothetical protein
MRVQLAMRLLAELMSWDDNRATEEFAWLKLIVEYKYDHYQGYNPGTRFFVNFLSWLAQFSIENREIAYQLVRKRVIFISQREMHHLVGLTMPRIQRENRKAVADELGMKIYHTWGDRSASDRLSQMSIRTLYVGLSDGAKTDVFRRYNEGVVSNEQIVAATEISDIKWDKLNEKLRERLDKERFLNFDPMFERICLIDDFTASGTSLIRKEDDGRWKGKVPTFLDQNISRFTSHIFENCTVQIHHYLGTEKARETISQLLEQYKNDHPELKISFNLTFSMVLGKNIVIDKENCPDLVQFLEKYYGKTCESTHTKENIWLGFKQCGLPLILEHNTPNNSVALIWATTRPEEVGHIMKPLFPRKQRHVDHGQSV